MNPPFQNLEARCRDWENRIGRRLQRQLGYGYDGNVFETDRKSAVKFLRFEALYQRERDVYLRLREESLTMVRGCNIPILLNSMDDLWAIEMTIVQPPYVLDFASARLDDPADFPEDVISEWLAEKQEQFADDWPEVRKIMATFARYGIALGDVNPRNIVLRSTPQ